MPAALLPASPEDEPIGCRTRTRLPMQHISLDELDALLGEEGDELFDEEGEQYQQFLRVRELERIGSQSISCMPLGHRSKDYAVRKYWPWRA